MKIVWFKKMNSIFQKEKAYMVVQDTFPYEGEVPKQILMDEYFKNNVLFYPDIPSCFGGEEETMKLCHSFMEEAMNCSFEPIPFLPKSLFRPNKMLISTEITPEVFNLLKSSYCPYFAENDRIYKIGDKFYYQMFVESNGGNWGCKSKWVMFSGKVLGV